MQQIKPAELADWAKQQSSRPVLLDVREAWEVQAASVRPEAMDLLHMPMQSVPARLQELDQERPVACLCHHGVRSRQVAQFLLAQGYQAVNVAGGIDAWSAQVDPQVPVY